MATSNEMRVCADLREQAREIGLCDEWYGAWSDDCTFDELIGKFITGYDFCVAHDWPSPSYIVENFPLGCLRANGVFCNDDASGTDVRHAVVMGRSRVELEYTDFSFGDVRVRHTSHALVRASALSVLHIHVYDHASLHVDADDGAKVTVFVHSHTARVSHSGNIVVKYGTEEKV